MSVRRNTTNRLTLYRTCGTCSEKCFAASYKHIGWYDGKAEERRKLKEARRDWKTKNRKYREAHAEELREKARLRRLANPGMSAADSAYDRKKRKLLAQEAVRSA